MLSAEQVLSNVSSQLLAGGYLTSSSVDAIPDALAAAINDGHTVRRRRASMPVPTEDLDTFPEVLRPLILAARRRVGMASTVLDPLPATRNSDSALILGALDDARRLLTALGLTVDLSTDAQHAVRALGAAYDRLRARIRERIPEEDPDAGPD